MTRFEQNYYASVDRRQNELNELRRLGEWLKEHESAALEVWWEEWVRYRGGYQELNTLIVEIPDIVLAMQFRFLFPNYRLRSCNDDNWFRMNSTHPSWTEEDAAEARDKLDVERRIALAELDDFGLAISV